MTELKIALVGSAPTSCRLAPYQDPSWQIWGCSPGLYGVAQRIDLWFELHRFEPGQTWFSPEYCMWMAKARFKVMMAEKRAEIPPSEEIPAQELVAKYGPYFFTSSLAWMMAMAMEMGATKIGLWGVDMAADEEYGDQRSGLHYFAMLARAKGIEVGTPPESDLFRPRPLYGVDEIKHSSIKMLARKRELEWRLRETEIAEQNSAAQKHFLKGALSDLDYCTKTWADGRDFAAPADISVFETAPAAPDATTLEVARDFGHPPPRLQAYVP